MKNALSSYRLPAALALALLAAGGAAGCTQEPPPPSTVVVGPTGLPVGETPIYCYRTLAGADCYAQRLDGPPNRLIRGYEPIQNTPQDLTDANAN
ncbi:MAG: hypothetical protein GVY13_10705 [Alphaproteobacteria bacterium]|jgi:hypothetical protein|nr:hypothetical protein [Alphaproteobacteria bacterium]